MQGEPSRGLRFDGGRPRGGAKCPGSACHLTLKGSSEEGRDSMAEENPGTRLVGLVGVGGAATGVVSLLVAVIATLRGEFLAAGFCLMASALAFGLLANALLRD